MNFIRNPVAVARLFFVLITTLVGYWLGRGYTPSLGNQFAAVALLVAIVFVVFEVATNIVSSKKILLASLGMLVGLVMAWFIYPTIPPKILSDDVADGQLKARILCNLLFGYFGIILALKHDHRISFSRLNFILASPGETAKILDTSVIIDGRIKDLLATNFLSGNLLLPEFVLDELHRIADSADGKKRARGRRGLHILDEIRELAPRLAIWEKDYPDLKDVDHKLISLAKELGGEILTNDYNLQKVAQLHNVRVLNINELANVLKPSVFVGEEMNIYVAREGKEPHQGVGYLEDGTMVVIEEGRSRIGTEVDVVVTSILQTPAGRMVFARAADAGTDSGEVQRAAGRGEVSGQQQGQRRPRERV
ncbi:MAG: TRAM domain-containing protein [Candidatus Sumerlaeaceae bacterium]|nr:TRAM domain-containing protein [Candidatus Sumerlaeaceae bacterium]